MTIDWPHFSPFTALVGGAMLALSAGLLLFFNGRIAGVSGIIGGLLRGPQTELRWRLAFVAGLLAAPLVFRLFADLPAGRVDVGQAGLIAAGLLVGYGSRLGAGCTSGHGVCGLSRLSLRSLVATLTFMGAGFITVFVTRHLLG
ncbi:YeeE/YedE family protein [Zoogloea sp.]|uniref:YeeE/YedE family protein n=1 Tax=Zoogloea sp. TaxID=49181 RepID=UPI0035B4D5FF